MAKKSSSSQKLVIVESPAKARTIGRYLGPNFVVEASIGHIRDLPQGAKECPEEYRKEEWSHLGVNVDNDFEPIYVVPRGKGKQVRKLKSALNKAGELYLATDEDREGEAISWHLCEVLQPQVPVRRLVFHEITREAIENALEHPRTIDEHLVRAQEARRIIDRLFGYEVSPLLWRKVRSRLSAGRVQSVAVRLIVDRERQRMRFVRASYWDLLASFATERGEQLEAGLVEVNGRRVAGGRDFDPETGKLKDENVLLLDQQAAESLVERVKGSSPVVADVAEKPYTSKPYPPFTTSTLQQEANRKLNFTARHTMQLAQRLYETGHITYMRTDSTTLASAAVDAARQLIKEQYGDAYLPDRPRIYQTKVKNAQEAHEAIRPAGHPFTHPDALRNELSADELRLYELIWKRTVACQMADARGRRTTVTIDANGASFQVTGKTIDFAGYLRAYVEGSDTPEADLADRENILPPVVQGQPLRCIDVAAKGHETQPPNRYTEASLTRTLEEMGIGRPSTYASIIDTILARKYVFKRGSALVPTWTAFAVCQLLEEHFPKLIDYRFTAQMEDELDAISRGELGHVDYLRQFYFGNDTEGLKSQLANKVSEIDARSASRIFIGRPADAPADDAGIVVRIGKFGPFLEWGDRQASIPDTLAPDELTIDKARELIEKSKQGDEPIGYCPETGKAVYLKTGRFGPYVQLDDPESDEKPKNASLLKGMKPEDVTLDVALRLLSLPRELGKHPASGEPVMVHNGRYGPYVKCGEETRSIPADKPVLDMTLEQALELLAQPKTRGRRRAEPVAELGTSPVTEQPVRVMTGRYGPYVTDGETNASLPKEADPEKVTLETALAWLAAKAAEKPKRKRSTKKAKATKTGKASGKKGKSKKASKKKGQ